MRIGVISNSSFKKNGKILQSLMVDSAFAQKEDCDG